MYTGYRSGQLSADEGDHLPEADGSEEKRSQGLLTHHHCASATVPPPLQRADIVARRAIALVPKKQWASARAYIRTGKVLINSTRYYPYKKQWAIGPSVYPPFARAGDQPQGWWWVSSLLAASTFKDRQMPGFLLFF